MAKRKLTSLRSVLLRYLLLCGGGCALILVLWWGIFMQLINIGFLLPAVASAQACADARETVASMTADTFDSLQISDLCRWAVVQNDTVLQTNMDDRHLKIAINAFHGGSGNPVSLDLPVVLRVTVQQMAASIPGLNSRLLQEDCGVISNGDRLWPLVLGLAAGLLLFFAVPRDKLRAKTLGALAGLGFAFWALPALLLALSSRYQQPEAITWQWGYIPAAASSIGFALLAAALLALLANACMHLPQFVSLTARLALTAALAAALCLNGSYLRGVVRTHHAENLAAYQFFVRSIEAGLADGVAEDDLILCNENVWDSNADAETAFFSRFTGRDLHAAVLGTTYDAPAGNTYAYQTYRNYGGYDLAWCGRLQSADSDLMDGVQILVQGALVPDNAVIKYKVRLPDGTEEARSICLLDCTRTDRDANGDYLATVEDTSILNAKLMIWDG